MSEDIYTILRKEILENDNEVRRQFLTCFESDIYDFISAMEGAYQAWQKYDGTIGNNKRRAYVSAFLFNALNNLACSMKLFISGYMIPSGNLIRQTIESLCLAILCSKRSLSIYERIEQNKFSPQKAINLVQRHANTLKINRNSISVVKQVYEFYHNYSHSSLLALTTNISLSQLGIVYIGPSFDNERISSYKKEIDQRLNLAKVFSNVVEGMLLVEK